MTKFPAVGGTYTVYIQYTVYNSNPNPNPNPNTPSVELRVMITPVSATR